MNTSQPNTSGFRYLRDPLFLACVALYFANRLAIKPLVPDGFVHEHFNDLICIPFWVPIMLRMQKAVGLRPVDAVPAASEVFIPLVAWSLVFEFWLPSTATFARYSTGDYRDIVWYAVGAMLAACWWTWWYGESSGETTAVEQQSAKGEKEGCVG
jgi:hypothetical protein